MLKILCKKQGLCIVEDLQVFGSRFNACAFLISAANEPPVLFAALGVAREAN